MDSPLERIAFLARSENRMRVLRTVAAEPQTRQKLREDLSMSRTTLGRVLNEFEERDMIMPMERGYATTVVADAILEKFIPLLETMEGLERLGEAVEWLPPPAREIEFHQFRDAEITKSTAGNPAEPFDRGLELIRAADRYRGLTSTAIPRYVRAIRDGLVQGRLDTEGVVEASVLETIRAEPERVAPWYDFAEGGATGVYEGRVPINMHIVDDRVLIWLGKRREDRLDVRGLLESTNPAVLSWAESVYDEYWAAAEPLDPAMLPEP